MRWIATFAFMCVIALPLGVAQTNSVPVCQAGVSTQTAQSDKGLITVGCPKIWVSDRIFTVLDGLLRDVDSITLKNLQGLDPNSVTGADLLSIANEFQANVKYDQGAAVANAFKVQRANAQRSADLKQFDAQEKIYEANLQRQQTLNDRKLALQEREYQLTAAGKLANDPEMARVKAEEDLVTNQLAGLQTTPPTAIPDQNISSGDTTQATAASTSLTALDQDALQKAFGTVLQNPKLPASMQMDNVIDLLRQRLAREFAVMYDDLSRQADKYSIYLAQFDVGLIPGRCGKKQHPRVQITFNENNAVAYDLFPIGSAYNTTTGLAKTSRIGITGAAQTLFGFGLSAAYSHSRNEYRSSLTQTLYVSAFGAGTSQFGWTFGTAPFEDFISSGSRAVYALLLVPKDTQELKMRIATCWLKEGRSRASDCSETPRDVTFKLPGLLDPARPTQKLEVVSYQPYYQRTLPAGAGGGGQAPAQPTSNTVQLVFTQPIDPNMTITVNDKILRRVRDVRGRALYAGADDKAGVLAGNKAESDALNKSRFGILESDTLEDDTWFQVNSKAVLLNISKATAGTDLFPIIRVSDPRSGGRDVFEMASDTSATKKTQIRIAEWTFTSETVNGVRSAFSPLFTEPYDPGRIKAYVDEVSKPGLYTAAIPTKIRIVSETRRIGRNRPVWLHDQAQVVLEADGANSASNHPWALDCNEEEGSLECTMPVNDSQYTGTAQESGAQLKLWVEEPPYYERPGLWADTDLQRVNKAWAVQPYVLTDWADVHEFWKDFGGARSGETRRKAAWNAWEAKIAAKNLDVNGASAYCITGLPDTDLLDITENKLQHEANQTRSTAIQNELARVKNLRNLSVQPPVIEIGKRANTQDNSQGNRYKVQTQGCKNSPVISRRSPIGDFLSLTIPFEALPYLEDSITVSPDCIEASPSCQDIVLPDLKSRLLPGPVTLAELKGGGYRLQGDHLQAVTGVSLIHDGIPRDINVVPGVNNVDFFLPTGKQRLESGSYTIYLLLNQLPMPAIYLDGQKKVQPLTLTIAKAEEKIGTPSKDKNSTKKDKTKAGKADTSNHSNSE